VTHPFDIFRYDEEDHPVWIQACDSMLEARQFVQADYARKAGKYMIFDRETETRIPVTFD